MYYGKEVPFKFADFWFLVPLAFIMPVFMFCMQWRASIDRLESNVLGGVSILFWIIAVIQA